MTSRRLKTTSKPAAGTNDQEWGGEVKAEKLPASPQCTGCSLWKYGAVSCVCFNLRYALNEILKELPFFCTAAEEKFVCPNEETKNNMIINVSGNSGGGNSPPP